MQAINAATAGAEQHRLRPMTYVDFFTAVKPCDAVFSKLTENVSAQGSV